MSIPTARINELNEAETPARELLEKLGYGYVPRAALARERGDERDVHSEGWLLSARLSGRLRVPVKEET